MSLKHEIQCMVNEIPLFDTHEHVAGFDWGIPADDKTGKTLPQIIFNDYLLYLAPAARYKGPPLTAAQFPLEKAEEHWLAGRGLLESLRPLTIFRALLIAFKDLYGFESDDVTDDNWRELNEKVVHTYQTYGERRWLAEVLHRANICHIVQFCYLPYVVDHWDELPPEERSLEREFIRPSLLSDAYAFTADISGFEFRVKERQEARRRTFQIIGLEPTSYTEYLDAVAKALALFRERGGVGIKLLAAYYRNLFFDRVPEAEARALYERGPENLNPKDHRRVEDNLLWHLLDCAKELRLAASFHTGYATPTSRGDPSHLLNLITAFPEVPFDLCHAGCVFPEEHAIMARSFPNVYFNFAWTPLLSASLAKRQLSEIIEIVPSNKLLLGLDTGSAESCYGAAVLTRRILAEVLTEKVAEGAFPVRVAETVARRILNENAQEVFGAR